MGQVKFLPRKENKMDVFLTVVCLGGIVYCLLKARVNIRARILATLVPGAIFWKVIHKLSPKKLSTSYTQNGFVKSFYLF